MNVWSQLADSLASDDNTLPCSADSPAADDDDDLADSPDVDDYYDWLQGAMAASDFHSDLYNPTRARDAKRGLAALRKLISVKPVSSP